MCGITGAYCFSEKGRKYLERVSLAVDSMKRRGPDMSRHKQFENLVLGHSRLSVIDTSSAASQPLTDASGRYTIVFNGEFFNYEEYRNDLIARGYHFTSTSDTEVLLYLYIAYGKNCLEKINGFFSFVIYDKQKEELFMARDRSGEKPFIYYIDETVFLFASEMKALAAYEYDRSIDRHSFFSYLQLNYIPGPHSIFENVKKLMPGHYAVLKNGELTITRYHKIENNPKITISYREAQESIRMLMDAAVRRRLVADVPLGAFLSGGIDSSIVVAIASQYKSNLQTFSIGYQDEPFFDETHYANLVAQKFGTKHTVFSLTNNDLLQNVMSVLDYIDEPFADSSALAVYMVSKYTREHVTVALSGDGADEIFAGYNKHMAHYRALSRPYTNSLITSSMPLLRMLPKSRNSKFGNKVRQLYRYGEGLSLNDKDRYWRWCAFADEDDVQKLLTNDARDELYEQRKAEILQNIEASEDLNSILLTDMNLVLTSDMLTKVDMMSMANSLEVRSPFLDHTVFDYAFTLPSSFKIDELMKKKLLQDAYRNILPDELYNRPKKGFEVPMLKWLRNEMQPMIREYLLNEHYIKEQRIFRPEQLKALYHSLMSNNPDESHARIWAILVFQHWYRKYIKS